MMDYSEFELFEKKGCFVSCRIMKSIQMLIKFLLFFILSYGVIVVHSLRLSMAVFHTSSLRLRT